jgi:hypothetical protein
MSSGRTGRLRRLEPYQGWSRPPLFDDLLNNLGHGCCCPLPRGSRSDRDCVQLRLIGRRGYCQDCPLSHISCSCDPGSIPACVKYLLLPLTEHRWLWRRVTMPVLFHETLCAAFRKPLPRNANCRLSGPSAHALIPRVATLTPHQGCWPASRRGRLGVVWPDSVAGGTRCQPAWRRVPWWLRG